MPSHTKALLVGLALAAITAVALVCFGDVCASATAHVPGQGQPTLKWDFAVGSRSASIRRRGRLRAVLPDSQLQAEMSQSPSPGLCDEGHGVTPGQGGVP